jgi:hypothetical protein
MKAKWCTPANPDFRGQRHVIKASLDYRVRACLKNTKSKHKKGPKFVTLKVCFQVLTHIHYDEEEGGK